MTHRKSIQALLLLAILAVGSFVTFKIATNKESQNTADSNPDMPGDNLLDIKGFSVSNFSGEELVYAISTDELKISPRRFSIFKIRIYNQASMKNAHIQAYLAPGRERLELFPLDRLGTVNRNICDGFQLDIYRGGEHIFNVSAEQARADLIRKKTTLLKTVITHVPSEEKFAGRSVVWDEKSQNFIISGSFLKETKAGRTLGKGIRIDLLYHQFQTKIKPMRKTIPVENEIASLPDIHRGQVKQAA